MSCLSEQQSSLLHYKKVLIADRVVSNNCVLYIVICFMSKEVKLKKVNTGRNVKKKYSCQIRNLSHFVFWRYMWKTYMIGFGSWLLGIYNILENLVNKFIEHEFIQTLIVFGDYGRLYTVGI